LRWWQTTHQTSSASPVPTKEVSLLQQGCRYPRRRERRGPSDCSGIAPEITTEELEHAFGTDALGDWFFKRVDAFVVFSPNTFAHVEGRIPCPFAVGARTRCRELQKATRDLPSTESKHSKKQFAGYKASHCVMSREDPANYYELDFTECSMKASHNGLRRRRHICAACLSAQPAARLLQEINTRSQSFLLQPRYIRDRRRPW
jgi:hypothetical protein